MGFIANYVKAGSSFAGVDRGKAKWREIFNRTDKEEPSKPVVRPVPGGTAGRSIVNSEATKRLIQALRSQAPGSWSDDRWEQTMRHYIGAPYVAMDRKGRQLSRAEFQICVKDPNHPDGKRPVTEDDPPSGPSPYVKPYDLVKLLEKPNNQDSFGLMMWRWEQQLDLTGTALTYMVPNMLDSQHVDEKYKDCGTPFEMYCLPTALCIPQPAINPDHPDGYYRMQPIYPYGPFSSYPSPSTSVGAPIDAKWMLRFQYPHPLLRYDGYSPLTGLRMEIDEFEMIGKSRHYKMRRSKNPDAVMNFDEVEGTQGLPDDQIDRIHAEWEAEQDGPENHGKLIVGYPGSKIEQWGTSPREMDWPNSWSQLLDFILGGGFGITKPAAGMVDDASYSTLYATLKQLYLLTLEPQCDLIAAYLTRHLAPFFGRNLIIEIRCKPINDDELKEKKARVLMDAKAITKNEIRKMYDEPTTDEEWGDEFAGQDKAEEQLEEKKIEAVAAGKMEMDRTEPKEVTESRPTPGPLGRGALGPRKSMYSQIRKVLANGSH